MNDQKQTNDIGVTGLQQLIELIETGEFNVTVFRIDNEYHRYCEPPKPSAKVIRIRLERNKS